MSTTAGYVYVMINPSFNGLVKIGNMYLGGDGCKQDFKKAKETY